MSVLIASRARPDLLHRPHSGHFTSLPPLPHVLRAPGKTKLGLCFRCQGQAAFRNSLGPSVSQTKAATSTWVLSEGCWGPPQWPGCVNVGQSKFLFYLVTSEDFHFSLPTLAHPLRSQISLTLARGHQEHCHFFFSGEEAS